MPVNVKLPPQNVDAEESIIGCLLLDKNALIKVLDMLTAEDFYKPAHSIIFSKIIDLFEKRIAVDLVTLTEELQKSKQLEEVGGAAFVSSLVNSVPAAIHVEHYANIVKQKATLRRLITAAEKIAEISYDEKRAVEDTLDEAEQVIFEISQKNVRSDFTGIKTVLHNTFDRLEELEKNKGQVTGVPTGYVDLDKILGGLQKSDLLILAARPAMGKTSLTLNIAQNAAISGSSVGIFSLEMSKEQLVDRMLCAQAHLDLKKLRTGYINRDDYARLSDAMGVLGDAHVYIDDTPAINVLEMRTKCRRLQMDKGLDLVIIDYLQLMSGRKWASENRVQEISEISRSLKALARELNVPVIACSQLSRAVESRKPQIPQLSDLRESGSIEQDADIVMFIYRDDYYNPETSDRPNTADIIIGKHRNGPTGSVHLYFHKELTRFENMASGGDFGVMQ